MYLKLNEQQFRLNKINEIKDYFVVEIKDRELMSKILSKYIAYETTDSISTASFAAVIGAPIAMASASFSLSFSIFTGIVKKLFETTRIKKKNAIKLLC